MSTKCQKNENKMTMSYNMMLGYDVYDCFTMEHFRLRQRMTLTTKIYCWRLYILLKIRNEHHRSFHFCRAVLSTHSFLIYYLTP
jgi:hypothetical protein